MDSRAPRIYEYQASANVRRLSVCFNAWKLGFVKRLRPRRNAHARDVSDPGNRNGTESERFRRLSPLYDEILNAIVSCMFVLCLDL